MGQRDRIPPARFTLPWSRCQGWEFLGCRHGLALLICRARREALLWDPLTGHQCRVSFPPRFSLEQGKFVQNAAVMCAAASQDGHGHVHGDCRFTPFRLALVGCSVVRDSNGTHKFVCLYESETGVWGNIMTVGTTHSVYTSRPSVLVRDAFCWLLSEGAILEFDFQSQSIAVIQKPADANPVDYWSFFVVWTESSGLGLAVLPKSECPSKIIQLWERKCNLDGVVGWELLKTIQLDVLFSLGSNVVMMQGYDEDSNSILLSTFFGDYMLQLESKKFINLIEKQRGCLSTRTYYPYRNFYLTGSGDGGAEMSTQ
ncbi:uncharacterized protein [Aegilops tauschii subsp. strangulata]|uniref:uncharacterized protein n=1 Tax=Aegilops tauschii subsp. strangulata TaxID=200361 RepID=UPI00098B3C0F|nr:uncharacterized protein LOC109752592 [Aegilops tauschii subsp. strangulata]